MMKKTIAIFLGVLVCHIAVAGPEIQTDVVYGHKDGMALVYDVLIPEKANGAGIIRMMSGGWLSRRVDPAQIAPRLGSLLNEGYTVFLVYHGSAPRYKVPEAYADVSRAVRHIKANASQFRIDPERLGVTGGSAGGHLSLMVGLNSDEGDSESADSVKQTGNRVAAVVAYYPPVDLRPSVGTRLKRFPALGFDKELAPGISPILFVSEDDPPTMLIHGDEDTLVPDTTSRTINKALLEKGIDTDILIIKGAGHGFREPAHIKQASDARLAWFNKYLNPS